MLAGTFGAVQPKVNAVLAGHLDSALVAALVNFTVAWVCIIAVVSARPSTRATLARIRTWPAPRWALTGGLGGAFVVVVGSASVRTIGVAIFSVAFFAGQISCGLLVDRAGLGAGGRRPTGVFRVLAAVVAILAVAVTQIGRPVGEFAIALVVLVFVAGAAAAVQFAVNGRLAAATGDAVAATAVNVTGGVIALGVIAVVTARPWAMEVAWPSEPWLYIGGVLGVTIVFSLAVAVRAVGVLRATLTMLGAQLVAAFVVDRVVDGVAPSAGVIAGAFLIAVAVVLVGRDQVTA